MNEVMNDVKKWSFRKDPLSTVMVLCFSCVPGWYQLAHAALQLHSQFRIAFFFPSVVYMQARLLFSAYVCLNLLFLYVISVVSVTVFDIILRQL